MTADRAESFHFEKSGDNMRWIGWTRTPMCTHKETNQNDSNESIHPSVRQSIHPSIHPSSHFCRDGVVAQNHCFAHNPFVGSVGGRVLFWVYLINSLID